MRVYFLHFCAICYACYALDCDSCREDPSENSLLQLDPKPRNGPGIIFWSYGRSGTGSFKQSLISATGYKYCQNRGEPFAGHPPDVKSLHDCMQKGQLLLMIKPQHLHRHGGDLQSSQDFFKAAYEAGFRIVIGSFRENQLARDLSSLELMTRGSRHRDPNYVFETNGYVKEKLHYPGIIKKYEELRANYSLGVESAYKLGFTIVPLSFEDLIRDTCQCVRLTLKAVQEYAVQNFTECNAVATHISPPHANQTVVSRTTEEVGSIVKGELVGTPYEWMLNLDANDWPPGVKPQMPVPTWHARELISKKSGKMLLHWPSTS